MLGESMEMFNNEKSIDVFNHESLNQLVPIRIISASTAAEEKVSIKMEHD